MEKLRIGVISIDFDRSIEVAKSIMRKENNFNGEKVKICKNRRTFETSTVKYVFTVYDKEALKGEAFDQVIMDYGIPEFYMLSKCLLRFSCVPDNMQMIDDRTILM